MQYIGLDGAFYKLNFSLYSDTTRTNASLLHKKTKELLVELFPYEKIFEEVPLVGSRTKGHGTLTADFFLPTAKMVIEVQGEQHEEYIKFFHKNYGEFAKSNVRDKDKAKWCEINNITLVYLNHNESIDEWRHKIINS